MVEGEAIDRERRHIVEHVVSLELLEKVVLTGLVTFIFSRMLPGADPAAIDILVGVALLVVVNTVISSLIVRSGERPSGVIKQFIVMVAINAGDRARRPARGSGRCAASSSSTRSCSCCCCR
jgi:hypothetical protein